MRWILRFVPRRTWFQFSLRTVAIGVLAVNVVVAAWFHWTWEIELEGDDALGAPPQQEVSDHLLAIALTSLPLPGYDEKSDLLFSFSQPSSREVYRTTSGRCGCSVSTELWSKQRSRVRFDWQHGRQKHGLTRLLLRDGSLFAQEQWRNGELHGSYSLWYPSGNRLLAGHYAHGERDGHWTLWSNDGRQIGDFQFARGERIGNWWLHIDPEPSAPDTTNLPERFQVLILLEAAGRKHPNATVDYRWRFTPDGLCRLTIQREEGENSRRYSRQFLRDKQQGRQEITDARGQTRFEASFVEGSPVGWCATYDRYGECVLNAEFGPQPGQVASVNGRPVDSRESGETRWLVLLPDGNCEFEEREISWFDAFLPVLDRWRLNSINQRRAVLREGRLSYSFCWEWGEMPHSTTAEILLAAADAHLETRHGACFVEPGPYREPFADVTGVSAAIDRLPAEQRDAARLQGNDDWDGNLGETWQQIVERFATFGVTTELRTDDAIDELADDAVTVRIPSNATPEEQLAIFLEILDWDCAAEGSVLTVGPRKANSPPAVARAARGRAE